MNAPEKKMVWITCEEVVNRTVRVQVPILNGIDPEELTNAEVEEAFREDVFNHIQEKGWDSEEAESQSIFYDKDQQ